MVTIMVTDGNDINGDSASAQLDIAKRREAMTKCMMSRDLET